jgi:hypothetical protein
MDSIKRTKSKNFSKRNTLSPKKQIRHQEEEPPKCDNKRDGDTTSYAIGIKCDPGMDNSCGTKTPALTTGLHCDLTC